LELLRQDVVTEIDALVADIDARTGNEFTNLLLVLPTERTDEVVSSLPEIFAHTQTFAQ
jgi:hypothetical protein